MICYSKSIPESDELIVVVVNLDPHHRQVGTGDARLTQPSALQFDGQYQMQRPPRRRKLCMAGPAKTTSNSTPRCRRHTSSDSAATPHGTGLRLLLLDNEDANCPRSELTRRPVPVWELTRSGTRTRSYTNSTSRVLRRRRGWQRRLPRADAASSITCSDLGVTAIWLLPFYPSPLRDDGYDIADYTTVHPGVRDAARLQGVPRRGARRGLRVITELVINHTSTSIHGSSALATHPRAARGATSTSGATRRRIFQDARIIFKDFESSNWTWDPVAESSTYWHRFYSHQPDLNYDNPAVRKDDPQDGRLLVRRWGSTGCGSTPCPTCSNAKAPAARTCRRRTTFLKRTARARGREVPRQDVPGRSEPVARGRCRLLRRWRRVPHGLSTSRSCPGCSWRSEWRTASPSSTSSNRRRAIPESSPVGLFLRNHDELTLEMVTDEERDYMYRVYAGETAARINLGIRRRLAPLLGNNRRRIELMNGLLFSLPGTPVLYYGDEIGMGDNIYLGDRIGVRTPMQWSSDRNAGFSRGKPAEALSAGHHRPRVSLRIGQRRGPAEQPESLSSGG